MGRFEWGFFGSVFRLFFHFWDLESFGGLSPVGAGISPVGAGISPVGAGISPVG